MATKEAIREHLKLLGWTQDRWGSMRREANSREYRIKLQRRNVRVECKVFSKYPDRKNEWEWLRMTGAYYNTIKFHNDGCLQIGTEFFHVPRKQIRSH